MAKLSFKTSDEENNKKSKISLKLTFKKNSEQNNIDAQNNQQQEQLSTAHSEQIIKWDTSTPENFLSQVFDFFGSGWVDKFKNDIFVYSFKDQNLSEKQKFIAILKNFFTVEQLNKVKTLISQFNDKILKLQQEKQNLAKKNDILSRRILSVENELTDLEQQLHKLKAEYRNLIPFEVLIENFNRSDDKPQIEQIAKLLNDNFNGNDITTILFSVNFLGFWPSLTNTIADFGTNQKENMERIYTVLTLLLSVLRGLHPPHRRDILDLTAEYVNAYFSDYKFISPEQTLQIDPNIHNAEGIGGKLILEGRSFVVIRADTGKTVKFADIITVK